MAGDSSLGDGLLAGIRVLDFTIWRPGPYATQLLAELGAEVIKVEPPGGDPMRVYPALFAGLHAGKAGIVLDLKSDIDRGRALELVAEADVVIEGYRPGVADRLGIGYEHVSAVHPSVVYCSLSGYGQTGPLAAVPGHDLNYQAWAGVLAPDGGVPVVSAIPVADLAGGMAAALAICAACVRKERTGEGERIDLAMADVLATWTGTVSPLDGVDASTAGHPPGYGTYPTADGHWISLGVLNEDHFWRKLCGALDVLELGELDFAARVADSVEVDAAIAGAIVLRARDDLVENLVAAGVPVAPVLSRAEMASDPHFWLRGAVRAEPWQDPASGFAIRLADHPAYRSAPPPALDPDRDVRFRPRR